MFFLSLTMGPIIFNHDKFPPFLTMPVLVAPFLIMFFCLFVALLPRYPAARTRRASSFPARRRRPISPIAAPTRTRRRSCSCGSRSFPTFSIGRRCACASRSSSASRASWRPRRCWRSTRDDRGTRRPRPAAPEFHSERRGDALSQRHRRVHRDDPAQRLQGQRRHRVHRHHDGAGRRVPRQAAGVSCR